MKRLRMGGLFSQDAFDGILNQLTRGVQREFFFQPGLVSFNGLDTQVQFFGDLTSRLAFAHAPEDLKFAV